MWRNSWIYIYLTTKNNAFLSRNSKHVRLLQNALPDSSCHHMRPPPVEAAITHGDSRDSLSNRTTVYELFRAQYVITVPNQYPKYTIPCVRSLYLYISRLAATANVCPGYPKSIRGGGGEQRDPWTFSICASTPQAHLKLHFTNVLG